MVTDKEAVEARVGEYLTATALASPPGQDGYYARIALAEALAASREGNYGIGAVAVAVVGGTVREFRGRSAMISGLGVVDHAETRALLDHRRGAEPSATYRLDPAWPIASEAPALIVYGSLEPCPMCVCTLTNAGAARSVSTCADGALVEEAGVMTSDGSACAVGDKYLLQPRVWRIIQQSLQLRFDLLETTDEALRSLSWQIFDVSRQDVDRRLGQRRSR